MKLNTDILNKPLRMTQPVWENIRDTIGIAHAETGGIGFGSKQDMIVTRFIYDPRPGNTATYTLNAQFFNQVIQTLWLEESLEPIMIIHSHPVGFRQPSQPDIEIGMKYLHRFELDVLYFPLVFSRADQHDYTLLPYAFSTINNGTNYIKLSSIEIIPEQWASIKPQQVYGWNNYEGIISHAKTNDSISKQVPIDFNRVEQAVSISKMKESHLLIVGTGGAASFCKQIARLGIGKLTLIDPDLCANENMPRQSFQMHDAITQKAKVLALRDDIHRINPDVTVVPIQADFTQMPSDEIDALIEDVDIILMLTDSFKCQAFGNTVALKHQKMGIWAGYYTLSRAAELFFYIPGVTPGCFRCAVSSRYEAQAKKRIKILSTANTIFHSDLLDSYIGFMALALLHNDTEGYEFSQWFETCFNHNLIQIKTSPSYEGMFKLLHKNKARFFNFGAVWQEVRQETMKNGYLYNCPDCATDIQLNKNTWWRPPYRRTLIRVFANLIQPFRRIKVKKLSTKKNV